MRKPNILVVKATVADLVDMAVVMVADTVADTDYQGHLITASRECIRKATIRRRQRTVFQRDTPRLRQLSIRVFIQAARDITPVITIIRTRGIPAITCLGTTKSKRRAG